jgi:hypothetical protein
MNLSCAAWLVGWILVLRAPFAAGGESPSGRRFALIVGHNLGAASDEPLRFAEQDAQRFREILTQLGSVPEQDAILLQGGSAADLRQALARLDRTMRSRAGAGLATVIFYFAGHGDDQNLHLGSERFPRTELDTVLAALPAELVLAFVDACQTPLTGRSLGVRAGPSFDVGVVQPGAPRGVVMVRSSQSGEPAYESDQLEGAVFSHYLRSGLRGAADADQDGKVSLAEAYAFASRSTILYSARGSALIQHPSYQMELKGSGELVLTEPERASAVLEFPPGAQGERYLVYRKPSGAVLAEIVPTVDRPVRLAVPAGRLMIQRRLEDRCQVAEVDLPFGGRRVLRTEGFVELPSEEVTRMGGRLDLHPLSLSAAYAFRSDFPAGNAVFRQGPSVELRRRFGQVQVGLGLGAWYASYDTMNRGVWEAAYELSAPVAWQIAIGVTALDLGVRISAQTVYQRRWWPDRQRLEQLGIAVPPTTEHYALGFGAVAEIGWSVPLGDVWQIRIRGFGGVLALKLTEGDTAYVRAMPSVGATAGLTMLF